MTTTTLESGVEILLVEDSAHDAELARVAIRRAGFTGAVTHVLDGEQALELLERRANPPGAGPLPTFALLDLKLPRVDGLEVLRRLKGVPMLRRLPVVVFTSSREERDIVRAFELCVNSYVVKPVDFAEYCAALAQVVAYWTQVNEEPSYAVLE